MSTTPVVSEAEARAQKSRQLIINVMLTFFISTMVFLVGTYFFVIPRMLSHDFRIGKVEIRVNAVEEALAPAPEEAVAEAPPTEAAAEPAPAAAAATP